jgi:hypothetical protein
MAVPVYHTQILPGQHTALGGATVPRVLILSKQGEGIRGIYMS